MANCRSCLRLRLGAENAWLGHCVFHNKDVSELDPACEAYTDEELIDVLERLFVNRADTYAVQREDGQYIRVNDPLTQDILRRHLAGEVTIGAYQIDPSDNTVRWLCFDVDPEHVKDPKKIALDLYNFCKNAFSGKSVWLEASRHPELSYHVWVFFEPPIPAKVARFLGQQTLKQFPSVQKQVELFPKQDVVKKEEFGNLVKLPFGLHQKAKMWSCFLDPSTLNPMPINTFDVEPTSMVEKEIQRIMNVAGQKREAWFEREDLAKQPYRGKDPACILGLFKGEEEGWRNEVGMRLSCYLLNFKGLKRERAWKRVLEWNRNNKPPLDEAELRSVFDSALKGEYVFGCEDELLQKFCTHEGCPLAKRDVFPMKIVEEAEKTLGAPYLEAWTKEVYDETIVGEEKNKLLLHYLELSGKRKNPTEKQLIILRGDPGGGKTTLANETTKFHKTKKRGRFSEHALDYSDLSGYDILYLQEIIGVKREEEGVSTIRFLSADDQGYTVEVAVRDEETGRWTTAEYRIPSITVVSTTTMIEVYQQLERRAWTLNVDESNEQTERVLNFKADKEIIRFEYLVGLKEPSKNSKILRCMFSRLEDGEVIVPFAHALKDVFDRSVLRARGDYDKVLTLVKMRAWWFQKQRPYIMTQTGKAWFALPEDGRRALELAEEPLIGMLTELEKRLRAIITHVKELVKEPAVTTKDGDVFYGATAKKLAQKIGKSQQTALTYLNELVNRGVLSVENPKGRLNVYNFIIPEDQVEKKIGISSIKQIEDDLFLKFKEETKNFLERYQLNENLWMGDTKLDRDYIELITSPIRELSFNKFPSKQEVEAFVEKKTEISSIQRTEDTLKTSLGELEDMLRESLHAGTQQMFEKLAIEKSELTGEEARSFLAHLINEGKLALDPEGYWRWTK